MGRPGRRGFRGFGKAAGSQIRKRAVWVCDLCGCQHDKRPGFYCQGSGCDGTAFTFIDSTAEANRLAQLRLMVSAGMISELQLQPRFPLHAPGPHGLKVKVGEYRADFSYVEGGARVIEDVKGNVMTELSQWKIRHFEAEYGLKVKLYKAGE